MTNNFLPMFTWCSYTLVAVVVTVVVLAFFSSAPLAWFRLELFSFICDAGHSWLSSRTSFYFCCSPFAISHFATAHKMWATRIKRVCVCVCVRVLCVLALTLKNGPGKSAPHTPLTSRSHPTQYYDEPAESNMKMRQLQDDRAARQKDPVLYVWYIRQACCILSSNKKYICIYIP